MSQRVHEASPFAWTGWPVQVLQVELSHKGLLELQASYDRKLWMNG